MDVLIGVVSALVLWWGAVMVQRDQMSPGDLVVFLAYLKTAFRPVRDMAKYVGRVAKADQEQSFFDTPWPWIIGIGTTVVLAAGVGAGVIAFVLINNNQGKVVIVLE